MPGAMRDRNLAPLAVAVAVVFLLLGSASPVEELRSTSASEAVLNEASAAVGSTSEVAGMVPAAAHVGGGGSTGAAERSLASGVAQSGGFPHAGPGPFTVTFVEGGLPSGTDWFVVLNGSNGSSSGTSVSFTNVTPGVVAYEVLPIHGYGVVPSNGTLTIAANLTQGLTFVPVSPHPGTLEVYEDAPGGAPTVDPAISYQTTGLEPISNVYETLITYNGSSGTDFVPTLATCVPGTAQCVTDYHSTLIQDGTGAFAGQPEYWTFVIDPNARFYDPSTHSSWPVYPSDVVFSIARTCAFADLPVVYDDPGWIQCQSLLSRGNPNWDRSGGNGSGIHSPYNNTPSNILGSMLVNDSRYCPAAALVSAHGCITFRAESNNQTWPYFLELIADPLGASIVPCGWFTYETGGIPGWTGTSAPKGDGSCLLPDRGTTTNSSAWTAYLSGLSPTGWDSFEKLAYNYPAVQPQVQWDMVGSGPYSASIDPGVSYQLTASPAYEQPAACSASSGVAVYGGTCDPPPGSFPGSVEVTWENNTSLGLSAVAAGQADFAEYQVPQTPDVVSLASDGLATLTRVNTISSLFLPMDLNWSDSQYMAAHLPGTPNIPANFLSGLAARQLLVHAYPYTTIENTVATVDGIPYANEEGGPIPPGMSAYYPTNVSFPAGDPDYNPTDVGGAAWWWSVGTNSSSPYYDAELAACTVGSPCRFPLAEDIGQLIGGAAYADWIDAIENITSGAVQPTAINLTYAQVFNVSYGQPPGENALPVSALGWAPDYFDPTDYVGPLAAPGGPFVSSDAVSEQLALPAYDDTSGCHHSSGSFADLAYWAKQGTLAEVCQGVAYQTAVDWMNTAEVDANESSRAVDYDLVESILNELALYVWQGQLNDEVLAAPWIAGDSINENPMIGGSGSELWYDVQYRTSAPAPATVSVGSGPDAVVYDPANGDVYAANFYSGTVSVINATTQSGVATVAVGAGPRSLLVDPSSGSVYVADLNSNSITVINATTNTPAATVPVGDLPYALALDGSGSHASVYVANYGSSTVTRINASSNAVRSTISVGSYPEVLAVDTTNADLFVANFVSGNVSIIAGSTVTATVPVGRFPEAIGFDPATNEVYVANSGSDNVSVISGSSLTTSATVTVGGDPGSVLYDPVGQELYVANFGSDSISVINGTTHAVVTTVEVDPIAMAVNPVNGDVYVVDSGNNTLSIISASTNTVSSTVSTGSEPTALAVDPTSGSVYVANEDSGSVSVVPPLESIRVTEVGLASGIPWWFALTGLFSRSTDPVQPFDEPSGTYAFEAGAACYDASPNHGTVLVGATGATVTIDFTPVSCYPITLHEAGLPKGSSWSVANNDSTVIGTEKLVLSEPEGPFSYTIVPPVGYGVAKVAGPGEPNQTSGTEAGAPVTWTVTFGALESLYFNETGLPSGTPWAIELTPALAHGGPAAQAASSVEPSVDFVAPKGASFRFVVSAPSIYLPGHAHGMVGVAGHATTKKIAFVLLTSKIVFKESGLPERTSWSITVVGTDAAGVKWNETLSESTPTITFRLPSGAYAYTVAMITDRTPSSAGGTLSVAYPTPQTFLISWT